MTNPLSDFEAGYIECAFWSSTDDDGHPMDAEYCFADLAPEALESMRNDCARFLEVCEHLAVPLVQEPEQDGHDFWLTRNRHGAGFWDRGLGEVGDHLTDIAHGFGECDLYLGDDGRVYVE